MRQFFIWKIRRSKAEEFGIPPRPALRTPSTGVEATPRRARGSSWNVSKMATFLTGMMKKGYTQDEVFAVVFESEREKKRRKMLAIVTKTVDAHRLEKMRELLAYKELATFRRMNGFDRDMDRVYDWRSLPPTPQEYNASLRHELQKLKDAISMPNEEFARLKRPMEKRDREDEELQKKMAEFGCDSLAELLANFEFAGVKEYVEKRSHEAAQAQVTVTPVDTVQHCTPCPPNPDMLSDVCFKLSGEGKMDPERGELESPSAGTGLETPKQQCPPNEGTRDQGRTTASGILTAGVGSNQGGSISSPTERAKDTKTFADISSTAATPENRRHKTTSEENKQFDPGGKGEKAPPWNAAVTLLSFSGESWEAPCLCFVFSVRALSVLCVCFVF